MTYNRKGSFLFRMIFTTRMTTSISSEARRNQTSILIRAEKITFRPKPDGQTDRRMDRHTDGRTDISIYKVASLPKI